MLIWGKKHVRRRLGYVADFCPLCREVRAFELERVGLAGHLYYISLTEGELVGHRARCTTCDTAYETSLDTFVRPAPNMASLRELIGTTFPRIAEHYSKRFAIEKAIRDPFAKMPAETRDWLLHEPFRLLSHKVEDDYRPTRMDLRSMAGFGAAFVGGSAIAAALTALAPQYQFEIVGSVIVVVALVAWGLNAVSRRRAFNAGVLIPLATALRPLKPTREELAGIVKDMKALGLKIGKRVRVDALLAELGRKS